jgi:hypothetical protein
LTWQRNALSAKRSRHFAPRATSAAAKRHASIVPNKNCKRRGVLTTVRFVAWAVDYPTIAITARMAAGEMSDTLRELPHWIGERGRGHQSGITFINEVFAQRRVPDDRPVLG